MNAECTCRAYNYELLMLKQITIEHGEWISVRLDPTCPVHRRSCAPFADWPDSPKTRRALELWRKSPV